MSVSTVSRALRGLDKVNPETRAKVEAAAERLHFSFSKTAFSLASGKSMRVAVLMPNEISSWFNAHTFEGIYEVLSREGYDVVPYVMWGDADLERFFHTLPGTQNIDAVFIVSFVLDVAKQRVLSSLTVPVVGINTPSTDGFDASVRMEGFLRAVDDQRYDDGHVLVIPSAEQATMGNEAAAVSDIAAQLIGSDTQPTGICVENDRCAVLLLKELRRLGWRIPEEVSLVGFDGEPLSDVADLTTVRQDPLSGGRLAANKAMALMRGETLDEPHTVMPTSLLMRATTARLGR